MKKIAVLTSGGDSPGMNAAIRAIAFSGNYYGLTVCGVERGYQGLIDDKIIELKKIDVSNIMQLGGTILKSARCDAFRTIEGRQKALSTLKKHDIEGLIVIGGDGSFMGAKLLCELGVPTIGIPGTIDNDLGYTDYTLGFDTACNTVLDAINKIRDTMDSHERVSIIEVMGRHCGDLALHAGLAGGAQVIVLPETPLDTRQVLERLKKVKASGRLSAIVVLSEGACNAHDMTQAIAKLDSTFDVRSTVLGHIQRGGSPTMTDRRLGTMFGECAVKLLTNGKSNRIVGIKDNKIMDMDITKGINVKKVLDKDLYQIAEIMSL